MNEPTKRCTRCLTILPLDSYGSTPYTRDGLRSECRDCHNEASRRWRAKRRAEWARKQARA